MQTADQGYLDYLPTVGQLHRSRDRTVVRERPVRSNFMVIVERGLKSVPKLPFIEHDHAIQTFPSDGPDQSLDIGGLPGALCAGSPGAQLKGRASRVCQARLGEDTVLGGLRKAGRAEGNDFSLGRRIATLFQGTGAYFRRLAPFFGSLNLLFNEVNRLVQPFGIVDKPLELVGCEPLLGVLHAWVCPES
jgi:hypothetical protein